MGAHVGFVVVKVKERMWSVVEGVLHSQLDMMSAKLTWGSNALQWWWLLFNVSGEVQAIGHVVKLLNDPSPWDARNNNNKADVLLQIPAPTQVRCNGLLGSIAMETSKCEIDISVSKLIILRHCRHELVE